MISFRFSSHAAQVPLVATAFALLGSAVHAELQIDPAIHVAVGNSPSGVAAADFDGDGDFDLAVTVDDPERIVVLLNDGAGGYSMGPSSLLPKSSSPQDLVAGDLDGDKDFDLAVALRDDPNGAVRIMLNLGNGSFTLGVSVAVGDRPYGLAIADMDDDGDLDVAVANRNSDTASVLTNDGSAAFAVETLAVGGQPRATAFGDFDDDGDQDLAVTNHDDRSVEIFTNSGGTFVWTTTLFVGSPLRPDGITAADLDGNGFDDLAVATSHFNPPDEARYEATIFMNSVSGFSGPFHYDTGGTTTTEVITADLDCDGLPDLVTSNTDSHNVSLLLNMGGGVFDEAMRVDTGVEPSRATSADFDNDGDPDVAVANSLSDDVSVLINQTCLPAEPCPWDLGGDGTVGVGDLLALLAAWGPNPGHPADFDSDGVVGIADMLALFANWGPCL